MSESKKNVKKIRELIKVVAENLREIKLTLGFRYWGLL